MPDSRREQRRQAIDLVDQHGDQLAAQAWATVRRHPHNAGCRCIVIDLLVELIELDYTITPPPSNNHQTKGEA